MTPSQLRSWMRKYGKGGVLMVAAYLGLRALWNQRQRAVIAGLLVVVFGSFLLRLHTHSPLKRTSLPQSGSRLAPPSRILLAPVHEKRVPERLADSRAIRAGRDRWRLEIWRPRHHEDETGFPLDSTPDFMKIFKNDHLLRTSTAEELGPGYTLDFGKPNFATRYPLIAIRVEPQCGDPCAIDLFSIRNGRIVEIGKIGGEFGGPVFRDFDGDGKPEWVFDDYDYYTHTGSPKHFLVYKEGADGKLTLWKRLPDPKGRFLPANLGLERW